ncbi:MAG: TetR family transcriptional regulator C-terminal domain-containing protein, partial [Blautia sp.]|nr:TetR family transcriptional regulator C-terminal domain-containing protein [Blautia sp.]
HFRDKYEVAAKIYEEDIGIKDQYFLSYSYHMLVDNLREIWKKRDFYQNVLHSPGQNSLFSHAVEKSFASSLNLYLSHHRRQPSQEEIYFFHFFTYGWANTLLEWLKGDYSFTPEELAALEYKAFPALITDTWKQEGWP